MASSSQFMNVYKGSNELQIVHPTYVQSCLGTTAREQTEYRTTMVREGYFYLTSGLILKAAKEVGFKKGQSTKAVAMKLLEWSDRKFDWFGNGFDWELALRIPDMIITAKKYGKNFSYRLPIL